MLEQNQSKPSFHIQRIYTKDISFEAPNSPQVFQYNERSEVEFNLNTSSNQLEDKLYEVVLCMTVTVSVGESKKTAFLCEVKQCGAFFIADMEGPQLEHCLGAHCPTILFPYAQECIASLVSRGAFPQLNLPPVNFDALYMDHLQQAKNGSTEQRQDVG